MKLEIFMVTILATIVLAACGEESINEGNLSKENETQNIKELVSDYSTGKIKAESASVTSRQLIVTDSDGSESVYNLPENDFFIFITPYVNETHPCTNHSLTGCQGEMAEKEFDVYIEDTEGNVIIDETLKSQSNGFIDLWLPRDKTYRAKIEHDGQMAESEFSTFESDNSALQPLKMDGYFLT